MLMNLEVEGFENSNSEKDKYEAGYNNDYDPFDDDYCNLYNIVFNEKQYINTMLMKL